MSDVELDTLTPTINLYTDALARIKEWEDIAKQCRAAIEQRLGDNEIGLLNGRVAVRWSHTTSNRLDQTLLKANYPEAYRACQTPSTSRRFTLVD